MIKNITPLDMEEVKTLLGSLEDSEKKKQIEAFIKKFSKIASGKAEQLRKELNDLGLAKLKREDIAKIVDLLPKDSQDLNKIFVDVSLDEDETNKILEIVKPYK
jgi:DNA-directed RNA polymerase subunit F